MSNTQAQSPSPATNMMDSGTTILLIFLAVLALVTILGILYGARLKHRRATAMADFEKHAEAAGQDPTPTPDGDAAKRDAAPQPTDEVAGSPPRDDEPGAGPTPEPAQSDLTLIKGLGPKLAARLNELGVTRLDQIASLTPDEVEKLDAQLGEFAGRITRDRWIEQAKLLAAGDKAGFEAAFGRL